MSEDDGNEELELWQGRGEIIFMPDSVVALFNWPLNPPTMTVVDEEGNEVDL